MGKKKKNKPAKNSPKSKDKGKKKLLKDKKAPVAKKKSIKKKEKKDSNKRKKTSAIKSTPKNINKEKKRGRPRKNEIANHKSSISTLPKMSSKPSYLVKLKIDNKTIIFVKNEKSLKKWKAQYPNAEEVL